MPSPQGRQGNMPTYRCKNPHTIEEQAKQLVIYICLVHDKIRPVLDNR